MVQQKHMTELLFIRHGESIANLDPTRINGRSNHTPLTARGEHQARLLGAHLRATAYLPDAIFSSGALRADTTARITARTAGYDSPISIDERLQEVSQGPYEGQLREGMYSPESVLAHNLDSVHGSLPGAESLFDARTRMLDFASEAYQQYPDGRLLIFSHGLAIRSLAGIIRGHTKRQIFDTATPNVSTTNITMTPAGPIVQYVGKTVISE